MAAVVGPRVQGRLVRLAQAWHAVVPHAQGACACQQRGVRPGHEAPLTAQADPLRLHCAGPRLQLTLPHGARVNGP